MPERARAASNDNVAGAASVLPAILTGLDEAEAQRRLAQSGSNAVQEKRSRGIPDIVRGILHEPMFLLLLAAAGLYLVLGDMQARASAFVALVLGNLVLAFADAAEPGTSFFDRRRLAVWGIGAGAAVIVAVVLYVPPLAAILQVSLPSLSWLAITLTIAVLAGGWFGLAKRLREAWAPNNDQRTPA